MGILYGMVTLKVTNEYANKAVDSFFKNTILNSDDKFVMVDNDGDFKSNWNNGRISEDNFILNDKLESFSYNMNILMRLAIKENKDLVFLSNDVIFTPNWSELLVTDNMTLSIPSCNQTHNLGIPSSLSMDEFGDRYDILNQISLGVNNEMKYFQSMLMPFYVLRIPLKILKEVGEYDEMFVVGGEDVDYRLRCLIKGFNVTYTPSFLLHFNGKSSWNGVETIDQTKERDYNYKIRFISKWGLDLKDICFINSDPMRVINKFKLNDIISNGDYNNLILKVINN
jgi:hypothetical protein